MENDYIGEAAWEEALQPDNRNDMQLSPWEGTDEYHAFVPGNTATAVYIETGEFYEADIDIEIGGKVIEDVIENDSSAGESATFSN
jgi:hypothetical protein